MKEQIIELMKISIQKVLSGDSDGTKLIGVFPNDVIEYIEKEIGGKHNKDWETNGWQWDYWIDFKIDNIDYTLSGDGYYGTPCFGKK